MDIADHRLAVSFSLKSSVAFLLHSFSRFMPRTSRLALEEACGLLFLLYVMVFALEMVLLYVGSLLSTSGAVQRFIAMWVGVWFSCLLEAGGSLALEVWWSYVVTQDGVADSA